MHPRVLATRRSDAEARTRTAAQRLAEQFGLEQEAVAALAVYDRDPDTRQVMRLEAVADLLEGLVEKAGGPQAEAQEDDQRAALEDCTVAELRRFCTERDLPTSGRKEELIGRLLGGESEGEEEEEGDVSPVSLDSYPEDEEPPLLIEAEE